MNKELMQSAKDKAAREYGYRDWVTAYMNDELNFDIINRAMEIYADGVNQETKDALTVCWKSLCTYGKHPIIEIQVNNILKPTKP